MNINKADVLAFIIEEERETMLRLGIDPEALPSDLDLLESGVIDSLGFISLLESIERQFGIEIDFGDQDPIELTKLEKLVDVTVRSQVLRSDL